MACKDGKAVFLETLFGAAMPPAFTMHPENRWRIFTDKVMGGLSSGGVSFALGDGQSFASMTGRVSTAKRGRVHPEAA
jgi:hypothetical protein